MAILVVGSCACGAVHFEARGEPSFQGFCQCIPCRKTGNGHSAAIAMNGAEVLITGECRSYETKGDSGAIVSRNFCPVCGSRVFNSYPEAPGSISINAALLDDPDQFRPEVVLYGRSALPWDYLDPRLPRVETGPAARST